MKMQINPYFQETYLTPGNTRDNFVFENCPTEFLTQAEQLLSKSSPDVISCVIKIGNNTEKQLSNITSQTDDDYIKNIIYRDFITSIIMKKIIKSTQDLTVKSRIEPQILEDGLHCILNGDFEKFKKLSPGLPFEFDIENFVRKTKKQTEINFILENTSNIQLQKAINNFISSRNPYSIKVFTNLAKLPTYYDQAGNLIEAPHDYMCRNVNNFISIENEELIK